MAKCKPVQPMTEDEAEVRVTCTDRASYLLEKFGRMRLTLDRIEGTDSGRGPDEDPGPGTLPLLELQLVMANKDATDIVDRLHALADRI